MMNRRIRRALGLGLVALCCGHSAAAQATSEGAAAQPAAGAALAPVVAERADTLLWLMGAYLAAADEFTFTADVTFDHVLPTGQKLQFAAREDVGVERPNRAYVDWQSDLGERRFWYDGSTLTIADPATPFYASEAAPDTLDATLDLVEAKLGFAPPLGDLLYADPYSVLRANVQYGVYLGTSEVVGRECHSLAFVDDRIDWQIWIDTGPRPTPCKLVITSLPRPGKPQISAVFSDWDFAPRIAASSFSADLEPGARQIPFKVEPAAASQP